MKQIVKMSKKANIEFKHKSMKQIVKMSKKANIEFKHKSMKPSKSYKIRSNSTLSIRPNHKNHEAIALCQNTRTLAYIIFKHKFFWCYLRSPLKWLHWLINVWLKAGAPCKKRSNITLIFLINKLHVRFTRRSQIPTEHNFINLTT